MATFTFHFGPRGQDRPLTAGGRGCTVVFFGLFLAMGLLFTSLMASTIWKEMQPYRWTKTPCQIVTSASEKGKAEESPYLFWVEYRYRAGGREFTSHRHRMAETGYSDYTEVQRLLDAYRPGAESACYVDPLDPSQSVLERESPASVLMILIPLVFVAVGGGGILVLTGALRRRDPLARTAPSISQKASGKWATYGLALFFSLFLAVGLGTLYPLGVKPILLTARAQEWREVPCTVVSSEVRSHEGDDSTTYSVDILYEYELGGRTYRSNRYDFFPGSSSGYDAKKAVVDGFPPGSRAVCYADPSDPAEAVLDRRYGWGLLMVLFPLTFAAVGGGGLLFALRSARRKAARLRAEAETGAGEPPAPRDLPGPKAIKPGASPALKFFGMVLLALFWNGITWVFLWQAIQGWRKGHPDVFLTLFMSIFALAGLGLAGGVVYTFLALFNPRVRFTLPGDSLRLGESVDLAWALSGGARRVVSLQILLEGREEADYKSGKNSHTAKEVFFSREIVRTSPDSQTPSGVARIDLPAGSMHSFKAGHNRIVWVLKVKGEIPNWPDVGEEFALQVLPGKRG